MTPRSNFDDRLGNWLDDGPTDAPGQLLDTILAAIPSIPQRRGAWRIPRRTSAMFGLARVLAGIVLAVGLGSALLFVVLRPTPGGIGGQASPPPAVVIVANAQRVADRIARSHAAPERSHGALSGPDADFGPNHRALRSCATSPPGSRSGKVPPGTGSPTSN